MVAEINWVSEHINGGGRKRYRWVIDGGRRDI